MLEKIQILLIVVPVVVAMGVAQPRKMLFFVAYWIVLVGAVRKWLLPQLADVVFFSVHLMLMGVYFRMFFARRTERLSKSLVFFLVVSLIWGVTSMFNFRSPSYIVGFFGCLIHFFFIPLLFSVHHLFPDKRSLMKFFEKYLFFSMGILALGLVQYFSPIDSPINQYVEETMLVAKVGTHARITGTFSYISGYTTYLLVLFVIELLLLSYSRTSKRLKTVIIPLLIMTLINLIMTGSRAPVILAFGIGGAFLLASARTGSGTALKILRRFLLVGVVGAIVASQSSKTQEALETFAARAEEAESDIIPRLIDTFTPFKFLPQAGLAGYGIGTTYQGNEMFVQHWGDMPRDFEEEGERIILEIGLVGYLLTYGTRILILAIFWKLFKSLRDKDLKLIALAVFLYQLQFLQLMPLTFNIYASFYYWFLSGFILLLPRLEKQELAQNI